MDTGNDRQAMNAYLWLSISRNPWPDWFFQWLDIKFSELNITGINNNRQLIFDILYTARLIFINILSNTAIEVFLIN